MPIFHVYLNGKKVSTAGVGQVGVLSAHLTWVRRKGRDTQAKRLYSAEEELTLHVGGLVTPREEHVCWVDKTLQVGDEVTIRVGDDGRVDRPRSRRRRNRPKELRAQKRYVRDMARKFGWKIQTQCSPQDE